MSDSDRPGPEEEAAGQDEGHEQGADTGMGQPLPTKVESPIKPRAPLDLDGIEPRLEGLDKVHLYSLVEALDERLNRFPDPEDYRIAEDYLSRAFLLFAMGASTVAVLDDMWSSSRCLRLKSSLHFIKLPTERLRSRRVDPVEIGLLGGERRGMKEIAYDYGIPITTLMADMARPALKSEVRLVTRYFDKLAVKGAVDLAGLGALAYSGALAAAIRGFDDESRMGLALFNQAARAASDIDLGNPHLLRYTGLHMILASILKNDGGLAAQLIGELHVTNEQALRSSLGSSWSTPPRAARYFDLSAAALTGLAVLRGVELPLDAFPESSRPYLSLLEAMQDPPERPTD